MNSKKAIAKKLQEATISLKKDQQDSLDDILPKLGEKDVIRFTDEGAIAEGGLDFGHNQVQALEGDLQASFSHLFANYIEGHEELQDEMSNKLSWAVEDSYDNYRRAKEGMIGEENDWDQMLRMAAPVNEEGEEVPQDGQESPKLQADVQRFMAKLGSSQFGNILKKIDTPKEQVEMIASFAELIGIPRAKLGLVVQQLRGVAESVKPRMKKTDLEKYLTESNKKKK